MILCLVSLAQRGVLETRPPNCTCQLFALTSDTSELRGRTWSACVREPTRGSPTENTIKTWWHSFPVVPPSLSLSLSLCDPVHPVVRMTTSQDLTPEPAWHQQGAHLLDKASWMSHRSLQFQRPQTLLLRQFIPHLIGPTTTKLPGQPSVFPLPHHPPQ